MFSEDYHVDFDPDTGEEKMEYDEDISYWPSPIMRPRPDWLGDLIELNRSLYEITQEIYSALDNDLKVLAATGSRGTTCGFITILCNAILYI